MATCKDCKYEMFREDHYSLRDSLWILICDNVRDILCIECAERRCGREIDVYDFQALMINALPSSSALAKRLGDFNERFGPGPQRAVHEIMVHNDKRIRTQLAIQQNNEQGITEL